MARHSAATIGVVAIVAATASLGAAATLLLRTGPSLSLSIGEAIFAHGTGTSGMPVPRSGGIAGGCSTCHGSDGRGLHTAFASGPDIAYANLTDPRGLQLPNGKRGPSYTDRTLRRAIVSGMTPSGQVLSPAMPRWRLNGQEWIGLLDFLKTLG
jgi:mono/diheme cytochrome c family protein